LKGSFAKLPNCAVITDKTQSSSTKQFDQPAGDCDLHPPAVQQAQQFVDHLLPQVKGHRYSA